jgi:hypothetical protein
MEAELDQLRDGGGAVEKGPTAADIEVRDPLCAQRSQHGDEAGVHSSSWQAQASARSRWVAATLGE